MKWWLKCSGLKENLRTGDAAMENVKKDKFFITEILNDLHRYGFCPGGKAETMLHDWAAELRETARPQLKASCLRRTFNAEVGTENW